MCICVLEEEGRGSCCEKAVGSWPGSQGVDCQSPWLQLGTQSSALPRDHSPFPSTRHSPHMVLF